MTMTDLHTHAAAWRSDVREPCAIAAMDQQVMERCNLLRTLGAPVRTGRSAGAAAMLSIQTVVGAVTADPRCEPESPTYAAVVDMAYAEGVLAAHMMDRAVPEDPVTQHRSPWPAVVAGVAMGSAAPAILHALVHLLQT